MIPIKVDQKDKGLSRLITVLQNKENIEKMLSIFLTEIQEIEDSNFDFGDTKNIAKAEGVWLDYLGSILSVERESRSDPEYRSALLIKVQKNISDGTIDSIINLVTQFTNATNVRVRDFTIGAFNVYTNGSVNFGKGLWDLVDQIKPSGVYPLIHTDKDDLAVLPAWETYIPKVEFLEYSDGNPNTDEYLELTLSAGQTETWSVVTELSTQYYDPDTKRAIPLWEAADQLEVSINNSIYPLQADLNGNLVPLEVFSGGLDIKNKKKLLCWEVEEYSAY